MRKHYSETFKADAVKALMKEEKTISQLAAQLGIHPSQLKEWKKFALQGLPDLFSRKGKARPEGTRQAKDHEEQVNELYNEIGRLTTQVSWLKKSILFVINSTHHATRPVAKKRPRPIGPCRSRAPEKL